MSQPLIDFGDDHYGRWIGWHPDRELNPQYANMPDVDRCTLVIRHRLRAEDREQLCRRHGYCEGAVTIHDELTVRLWPNTALWQVAAWEPLTLTPSVLCHCGDHGFITAGRWVRA